MTELVDVEGVAIMALLLLVDIMHMVDIDAPKNSSCKIQAVAQFVRPRMKKDVRSFLGLAGHYRRFIRGFAEIALPLTAATKKDLPDRVRWTDAMQTAFDRLKEVLSCNPVLVGPNFELPFSLYTDASDLGIGAVLSQASKSDSDHPVAYFSKQLLTRQKKYSTVEKEALAVLLGISQECDSQSPRTMPACNSCKRSESLMAASPVGLCFYRSLTSASRINLAFLIDPAFLMAMLTVYLGKPVSILNIYEDYSSSKFILYRYA